MPDFALDSLFKATLLLAVAGLVTLLWRRSAAPRHLVWTLALAGTLVVPAARLLGPSWKVPVLPALPVAAPAPAQPAALVTAGAPAAPARPFSQEVASPSARSELEARAPNSAWWLRVVWAAGLVVVLALYGAGALRAGRLARHGRPLDTPDWLALQSSLAAELGLRTPVRLLAAPGPAMLMTWGTRRPVVLLPADAEQWPETRRRDVLLHELAHVARRDCLTQLVALCACAVYWFHPLAWLAARRLRIERERACDDRVLAAGATPSAYAEHLLEIARTLRAGAVTGLASVAMARPSQLGSRLLDVLDPARHRDVLTRRSVVRAAAAAALVVLPLAMVHPTRLTARQPVVSEMPGKAGDQPPEPLRGPRRAVTREAARAPLTDSSSCRAGSPRSSASSSSSSSDDRSPRHTLLRYSAEGCTLELEAQGDFRLTTDFSDIDQIDAGGSVTVTERDGADRRRMEMRPGQGGVAHRYFVSDAKRPYDAEARAWLSATLTELLRRTGYAGDARSRWILQTRGPEALFQEIALVSGDYAKRVYYQELIAEGRLDPATVARVVTRAGDEIASDYDLAEVLILVADRYPLSEPARTAFVGAADHLQSDYDRHRVLKVVLAGNDLPDDLASAVLESAGGIRSDYDLAEVLIQLMSKHPITPGMSAAFFRAVDGIASDHDHARVLTTLSERPGFTQDLAAGVVASAGRIQSGYDRAEVLVNVARHAKLTGALRDAYIRAAEKIGSESDRNRALAALSGTAELD